MDDRVEDSVGVGDAVGECVEVGLGDGEAVGEGDDVGESVGVGMAVGEGVGLGVGEGDGVFEVTVICPVIEEGWKEQMYLLISDVAVNETDTVSPFVPSLRDSTNESPASLRISKS